MVAYFRNLPLLYVAEKLTKRRSFLQLLFMHQSSKWRSQGKLALRRRERPGLLLQWELGKSSKLFKV